jgi:hypothetical protein
MKNLNQMAAEYKNLKEQMSDIESRLVGKALINETVYQVSLRLTLGRSITAPGPSLRDIRKAVVEFVNDNESFDGEPCDPKSVAYHVIKKMERNGDVN